VSAQLWGGMMGATRLPMTVSEFNIAGRRQKGQGGNKDNDGQGNNPASEESESLVIGAHRSVNMMSNSEYDNTHLSAQNMRNKIG